MSAPVPAPWLSSVVATRTYAILVGLVLRRATAASPFVRVDGGVGRAALHQAGRVADRDLRLRDAGVVGADDEQDLRIVARVDMFFAPCWRCGLPLTASSCWLIVIVKPGTEICESASATPFAVGTPFGASPPVIGSSIPILIANSARRCHLGWRCALLHAASASTAIALSCADLRELHSVSS